MRSSLSRNTLTGIAIIAFGWLAVFAAVEAFRPLMPIDETRYLTVAWEMRQAHDWILPLLNGEPYSHKPPLIFWLIRGSWEIFGVSITAARLVIFLSVLGFLFLTGRLARAMFHDKPELPIMAALLMSAMPAYLVYGSVIMFDSIMSLFVMAAMMVIWRAGHKDSTKNWLLLGLCIGMGILAKGPVALVHILPAALLAPFWLKERLVRWPQWYGGLFMAVMIGAAMGLAWALPAAMAGGHDYAQRIFYTQSAGRMVDAFDHKEPWWFYFPVMLGFLLPLIAWPPIWRAVRRGASMDQPTRFLLCWILPSFLFFSTISSKSIHYVIPFLPGIAILAASFIYKSGIEKPKSAAFPLFVMLAPSVAVLICEALKIPFGGMMLKESSENLGYLHVALGLAVYFWAWGKPERSVRALAMGSFLLGIFVHAQLHEVFLPKYDLMPLARAMRQYEDREWAVAPKYDGEYGFMFRTTHKFHSIGREKVLWWLQLYPDGVVICRYKDDEQIPREKYRVLFEQPFRTKERIVVMEMKDAERIRIKKARERIRARDKLNKKTGQKPGL